MVKKYDVKLKGYVGGEMFDPDYIDYILAKSKGAEVNILIDSLGGSTASALSIAAAIGGHGNVNVHFVGMCASAATIASLRAKHISIDRNAMYLVHKCSTFLYEFNNYNADDMGDLVERLRKTKDDLDKIDANVAEMYASRCQREPKALLKLMGEGKWLSAQEALDWGFVDEVTDYDVTAAPVITEEIETEMLAAGIELPELPRAKKSLVDKVMSLISGGNRSAAELEALRAEHNTLKSAFDALQARAAELQASVSTLSAERDEAQARAEQLAAEVAALNSSADDGGVDVITNGAAQTQDDAMAAFIATGERAKKLYNQLP
ncbi:MAG: ATP-dependent Clp protease proteolytic subunit [Muribaculaceae bacterium]